MKRNIKNQKIAKTEFEDFKESLKALPASERKIALEEYYYCRLEAEDNKTKEKTNRALRTKKARISQELFCFIQYLKLFRVHFRSPIVITKARRSSPYAEHRNQLIQLFKKAQEHEQN